MSKRSGGVWDIEHPTFKKGDEVYTEKNYRAITINKPYIVLDCQTPFGMVSDYPGKLITLICDQGYESSYASHRFKKTERQIREDKITNILQDE